MILSHNYINRGKKGRKINSRAYSSGGKKRRKTNKNHSQWRIQTNKINHREKQMVNLLTRCRRPYMVVASATEIGVDATAIATFKSLATE